VFDAEIPPLWQWEPGSNVAGGDRVAEIRRRGQQVDRLPKDRERVIDALDCRLSPSALTGEHTPMTSSARAHVSYGSSTSAPS
jgi:hypothetical protein